MIVVCMLIFLFSLLIVNDIPGYLVNVPFVIYYLEGLLTAIIGFLVISRILKTEPLPVRKKFFCCFLLAMSISLLYLQFTWIPYLHKEYGIEKFDPIRYYYGANELVRYGKTDAYMNYFGVVYFYAFFMRIFGISPLVPLYVNALLSLYASLTLYLFLTNRGNKKMSKYFPFILFIPEVICFNALSSREIICMSSFTIVVVNLYELINYKSPRLFSAIIYFFLLLMVRPPFGLLAILCVVFYFIVLSKKKNTAIIFSVIMIGVMFLGMNITHGLSDSTDAFSEQLDVSKNRNVDEEVAFKQNSLSAMLTPHNTIEFFVYGAIRSVAYLLLTPGQLADPINCFFRVSVTSTSFYTTWTTLLMMISIPILYRRIRYLKRQVEHVRYILICMMVCVYVVGTFMAGFIHLRYRIVYDLIYFGVVLYCLSNKIVDIKIKHEGNSLYSFH